MIPERENLLEGVGTAGGSLFAYYLQDAQNRVRQYDYDGKQVRAAVLPAIGWSAASTARGRIRSSTIR